MFCKENVKRTSIERIEKTKGIRFNCKYRLYSLASLWYITPKRIFSMFFRKFIGKMANPSVFVQNAPVFFVMLQTKQLFTLKIKF